MKNNAPSRPFYNFKVVKFILIKFYFLLFNIIFFKQKVCEKFQEKYIWISFSKPNWIFMIMLSELLKFEIWHWSQDDIPEKITQIHYFFKMLVGPRPNFWATDCSVLDIYWSFLTSKLIQIQNPNLLFLACMQWNQRSHMVWHLSFLPIEVYTWVFPVNFTDHQKNKKNPVAKYCPKQD